MIVEPKMVLRVVVRENKITHEGIFTDYTAHLVGKDDNAVLAGATWQTVLLLKGFLVKELRTYTCLACQFYRKKSCGAGYGNSHAGAYGQCLAR